MWVVFFPILQVLLQGLIYVAVPAVTFFIYFVFFEYSMKMVGHVFSSLPPMILDVTGMGGWLIGKLKFSQGVAAYLSLTTSFLIFRLAARR